MRNITTEKTQNKRSNQHKGSHVLDILDIFQNSDKSSIFGHKIFDSTRSIGPKILGLKVLVILKTEKLFRDLKKCPYFTLIIKFVVTKEPSPTFE